MSGLSRVSFRRPVQPQPRLTEPYVPGRRRHARFWSEAEIAVLRAHYASGGVAACLSKLPGRHSAAIYNQARKLGLSFEGDGGGPRQEIAPPDDIDDRLRAAWPELVGRGAVSAFADRLGLPRWWVTKRATKLGLTQPHKKEPGWSEAEKALMRQVPLHDPDKSSEMFKAHGFARTPTSIMVMAKRLELSRRKRDTFSATRAAALLGIDGKTMTAWILAGDVAAAKRGTKRLPQQGGDQWEIQPAELRRFVIERLERIDFRKVDKFALVDLLVGDGGTASCGATEASPMIGSTTDTAHALVAQLCDMVEPFGADVPIAEAIARKRAAGADDAFEALLRRPWICRRCRFVGTVLDILVPAAVDAEVICPSCRQHGIAPTVPS